MAGILAKYDYKQNELRLPMVVNNDVDTKECTGWDSLNTPRATTSVLTDEIQNWEQVKEATNGDLCLTFNAPGRPSQVEISGFADRIFPSNLKRIQRTMATNMRWRLSIP